MAGFWGRMLPTRTATGGQAIGTAAVTVHWLDTTPANRHDKPCELRSLEVHARVRGVFAEVTQTMVIANPNLRPLSVPLAIPLPDRATVSGYALDVNGQMVDGVVVPKEQARVVFETEQRRGVDPGLVEAVRGNAYRTRVYPVPSQGTRTVRLRYVSALTLGADDTVTLELPMPAEHLDRRTMRIDVEQLGGTAPIIEGLAGSQVRLSGSVWSTATEECDLTPAGPVRVELPGLPASFALLERDERGTVWFCASGRAPHEDTEDVPGLRRLTVLWDSSGSRGSQDHARELELLRSYASAPTVRQIRLVVFADRVREVRACATARELVSRIEKLRYDGGTSYDALARELEALEASRSADGAACVLMSDGLDTLGSDALTLPASQDVLAIVSGQERDAEALRQACRGRALALSQAPRDAKGLMEAMARLGRRGAWQVGGQGLADVCDASAGLGERQVALGRLVAAETTLSLGGGSEPITLRADDATVGSLLGSAWASRRVSLLAPRAAENADELLRLGREHGVVSPATSLLVLESLQQWLEYDIEPPRSLEDVHAVWERLKAGEMRHSSDEAKARYHRSALAHQWASVMTWWERGYQGPAPGRRGVPPFHGWAGGSLFCPNCGAPTEPGMRFCMQCGCELTGSSIGFDGRELLPSAPAMAPEPGYDSYEASLPPLESTGSMPRVSHPAPRMSAAPMAAPARAMSAMASGLGGSLRAMSDAFGGSASDEDRETYAPDGGASRSTTPAMGVRVRAWMPHAPYLKALDKVQGDAQKARGVYFAQRRKFQTSPSFFVDCAGWFVAHDDRAFGVSVLTNLAEMRIEDAALLRVMAWRLREAGELDQALAVFRRVLGLRAEDSQSHRDLALVLSELARRAYADGDEDAARAFAEEAGELYRKTALTPWQRRAMAIGLFAVEEYNVLRAWAEAKSWKVAPELPSLGEDLEGVPDCDLRITLAWDADETDVDLHVTEPTGEEAYYGHRYTGSGGRVSEDITDGYGPELYQIRHAQEGIYDIRAHYYASHQQTVFGPATCTLTVYTDWGRPNQAQTVTTARLDQEREMVPVGTAAYGDAALRTQDEGGDAQDRTVKLGMTLQEVTEILGEGAMAEQEGTEQLWTWELAGGRRLAVLFAAGKVVRVAEQMSWGDEMVILQ